MHRGSAAVRNRAAALHKSGRISAAALQKAGLAPDHPSAEPVSDILAQLRELGSASRQAVWLPSPTVEHLEKTGALQGVLRQGEPLRNFDGEGGILVAKDAAVARQAMQQRSRGVDNQKIVGELTGDGSGKPADASDVVQQLDSWGNVTRERLTRPGELSNVAADFSEPGKTVHVTSAVDALARRAARVANEWQ